MAENRYDKFEMMIVQGNQVPDSHWALIMSPAWENGYIAKFYKHCYCFCQNCNYTILVTSKHDGYITLGGKSSLSYVDLNTYPNHEIYDAAPWYGMNCYNYTVTDETKDVTFKLDVYTGNPDLYINPIVPLVYHNATKAMFNSTEHFWNE
jgi:hypothetical protein